MHCRQLEGRNAGMTLGQSPNFSPLTPASLGTLAGLGPLSKHQDYLAVQISSSKGWRLGGGAGHTQLPRSWENATAAGAAAPPANKAPGGGIRAAHCRAGAASWGTRTAPQGPGHAFTDTQHTGSPGWASSVAASPATHSQGLGAGLKMLHFGRGAPDFHSQEGIKLIPHLPPLLTKAM